MIGGTMKSLFKSGARDLQQKFSKAEESEALDTPLNLRIGAVVDIDTLPFRVHAENLHIELPDETLVIAAQGYIDLGDGSYVHRFYTKDDTMLQVMTVGGTEDQHVEEVTLYIPYESYYPDGPNAWAEWLEKGGKLGATSYHLNEDTVYERLWFDTAEGHAEPVQLNEYIYEDSDSDDCLENHQKVMLFGRNLEDDKLNEYLLIAVESYGREETVELYLGVDIDQPEMKII